MSNGFSDSDNRQPLNSGNKSSYKKRKIMVQSETLISMLLNYHFNANILIKLWNPLISSTSVMHF